MNSTLSLFGRGLLVLALSGFAIACGDDDGDEHGHDGGEADGGGGTGGGGAEDAGGEDAGGGLTAAQCETMAFQQPGPDCLSCVCEENPDVTVACTGGCWGLVQCVATECGGDPDATSCIVSACAEFVAMSGVIAQAQAFGPVITNCTDVCAAPAGDGGTETDGGN